MESGKSRGAPDVSGGKQPIDAMAVLHQEIAKYKELLADIIGDSSSDPKSFNGQGEYKDVFDPDSPEKSVARLVWNFIIKGEDFLNNIKNPVKKMAIITEIGLYTLEMIEQFNKRYGCSLIFSDEVPNPKKLEKLDGKVHWAYVYVAGPDKQSGRLFYVNKSKKVKSCIELTALPGKTIQLAQRRMELNKAYLIHPSDEDYIADMTGHRHRWINFMDKIFYRMLQGALPPLQMCFDEENGHYNEEFVTPIIKKARKGIPVGFVLDSLTKFGIAFSKGFTVDKYLDVKNVKTDESSEESSSEDVSGDLSDDSSEDFNDDLPFGYGLNLNGDIRLGISDVEGMIESYEIHPKIKYYDRELSAEEYRLLGIIDYLPAYHKEISEAEEILKKKYEQEYGKKYTQARYDRLPYEDKVAQQHRKRLNDLRDKYFKIVASLLEGGPKVPSEKTLFTDEVGVESREVRFHKGFYTQDNANNAELYKKLRKIKKEVLPHQKTMEEQVRVLQECYAEYDRERYELVKKYIKIIAEEKAAKKAAEKVSGDDTSVSEDKSEKKSKNKSSAGHPSALFAATASKAAIEKKETKEKKKSPKEKKEEKSVTTKIKKK